MSASFFNNDRQPLQWWRGHPWYLSAFLGLFGLLSMVFTSILSAFGGAEFSLLNSLTFSFSNLWEKAYVWTAVTYLAINAPSIGTLFSCFILWRIGTELETYFGRKIYIRLLTYLALTGPLILSLLGGFFHTGYPLVSLSYLAWGVLAGFATLHPHARLSIFIATVPAWGLAVFYFAFSLLVMLSSRSWSDLSVWVATSFVSFAFITYQQGKWTMASSAKSTNSHSTPKSFKTDPSRKNSRNAAHPFSGTVDDLLDKISQHGMQSLSEEEKEFLHQESRKMTDKGR